MVVSVVEHVTIIFPVATHYVVKRLLTFILNIPMANLMGKFLPCCDWHTTTAVLNTLQTSISVLFKHSYPCAKTTDLLIILL